MAIPITVLEELDKFKEFDRYNSSNPYSATKAGAEELFVAYKNTYNLPICITHTMNIFGERQNPEKYIPMIIKKILNKEKIKIHYDNVLAEFSIPPCENGKEFVVNITNGLYLLEKLASPYKLDFTAAVIVDDNILNQKNIIN